MGEGSRARGVGYHVVAPTSVARTAGAGSRGAGEGAPPAARGAVAAGTAVPPHPGAVALLPARGARPEGVDHAGHLVAGDAGVGGPRHDPRADEDVAVADAARLDPEAHLAGARLGNLPLDQLGGAALLRELTDPHLRHGAFLPLMEHGARIVGPSPGLELSTPGAVNAAGDPCLIGSLRKAITGRTPRGRYRWHRARAASGSS